MRDALKEISLFYFGQKHQIGEIIVDAVIKENHELSAKATEHPTESGESFVDHVQNLPLKLQIEGVITNTPMRFIGLSIVKSLYNFTQRESNNLAEKAFTQLEKIFADRKPITIATSLKEYTNMVLESLSVERSAHTSASLHFRASAKQICVVKQSLIEISAPKTERVQPKVQMGKQETKQASEAIKKAIQDRSTLTSFKNWASSLWK